MITFLLLLVIYIAFISLGIPDSLLGAAWPAIFPDLSLPASCVSLISMLVTGGTVLSSFFSGRILGKIDAAKVTVISTALTAAALFGFSFSHSLVWFCLLAPPLGLGAGAIDTALNHYVALHFKPAVMSFLHCFYGIGVSLSPWFMAQALSRQNNWRAGYRTMALIQSGIVLIMLFSLPLWKRAETNTDSEKQEESRILPLSEAVRSASARACFMVFIAANALEAVCTVWGGTYLVQYHGFTPETAAGCITFYFVGLASGRFLSGLLTKKFSCMAIIWGAQAVLLCAVLSFFLPLSAVLTRIGLFLTGLGLGPLHPNMLQLTPEHFGKAVSQSMMGYEIGFAYAAILVTPLIFGAITGWLGYGVFACFLLFLLLLLAGSLVRMRRLLAKPGEHSHG